MFPRNLSYKSPVNKNFEEQYIAVRKKEGRIYSIAQLKELPEVSKTDPLFKEWQIRKNSAERFVYYLHKNGLIKNVLEIGCGNGWFSNYIAQHSSVMHVTGLDINEFELKQADEAFDSPKLNWSYADVFTGDLSGMKFDLIVFSGSIHYFPDLKNVLARAKELLNKNGEVHVLDSPFYNSEKELMEARKRTENYYTKLDFPGMSKNYNPHLFAQAKKLGMEILFKPGLKRRITTVFFGRVPRPFPWLRFKK